MILVALLVALGFAFCCAGLHFRASLIERLDMAKAA